MSSKQYTLFGQPAGQIIVVHNLMRSALQDSRAANAQRLVLSAYSALKSVPATSSSRRKAQRSRRGLQSLSIALPKADRLSNRWDRSTCHRHPISNIQPYRSPVLPRPHSWLASTLALVTNASRGMRLIIGYFGMSTLTVQGVIPCESDTPLPAELRYFL